MTWCRIRAARVNDAGRLTQIAARATKHEGGYDDAAIARFMPGLKINLALIAAGLVFVAEDEAGIPCGHAALRPTGMGGLVLLEGRLDVADKGERVYRYQRATVAQAMRMMGKADVPGDRGQPFGQTARRRSQRLGSGRHVQW